MKFISWRSLAGLIVALSGLCGCAESDASNDAAAATAAAAETPMPAKPVDNRPNAAVEYRRIVEALGEDFMDPLIDMSSIAAPNKDESAYLLSLQEPIRQMIEASKIERCEFQGSNADSDGSQIASLTPLRSCSRLLCYDAARLIQWPTGEREATERILAVLRMAQQGRSQPTLVALLHAQSIVVMAVAGVDQWEKNFRSPGNRARLRDAFMALRDQGLCDARRELQHEQARICSMVESGEFRLGIDNMVFTFSPAERGPVIAEVKEAFIAIEAAMMAEDAEQRISEIVKSMRSAKARAMLAGLDSIPRIIARVCDDLDALLKQLK